MANERKPASQDYPLMLNARSVHFYKCFDEGERRAKAKYVIKVNAFR